MGEGVLRDSNKSVMGGGLIDSKKRIGRAAEQRYYYILHNYIM
jgi:hypothetical protein